MGTDPVGVDMSFAQPVGLPIVSSSCLDDLCVCVGSCSEGGIRASFGGGGGGGGLQTLSFLLSVALCRWR
jgi:hypothetical protein